MNKDDEEILPVVVLFSGDHRNIADGHVLQRRSPTN
jgi:hypothetical protein